MAPGFKRVADGLDEHGLAGSRRGVGKRETLGESRLGPAGGFIALQFIEDRFEGLPDERFLRWRAPQHFDGVLAVVGRIDVDEAAAADGFAAELGKLAVDQELASVPFAAGERAGRLACYAGGFELLDDPAAVGLRQEPVDPSLHGHGPVADREFPPHEHFAAIARNRSKPGGEDTFVEFRAGGVGVPALSVGADTAEALLLREVADGQAERAGNGIEDDGHLSAGTVPPFDAAGKLFDERGGRGSIRAWVTPTNQERVPSSRRRFPS